MTHLNPLARILLPAWAVLLVGALTHPLLAPGDLALRDMLVLADPALSPGALGMGDLPARNVPQDGLLALVGTLIDASWFARLLIVAAATLGAVGAWWLVIVVRGSRASAFSIAAGMTIAVYNPFVVERLLQGQWSLVIAAWLMPLIAAAALAGCPSSAAGGMFFASLTPTGALAATVMAVATARTWGARAGLGLFGLAASAPWLIPGLLHPESGVSGPHSVTAFAPRAEQFVGTVGSLLGLGGIWNANAVPASRESGFALFGVVLAALLATAYRRCPRPLLIVAAAGLFVPLIAWLIPELLGWVVSTVPGGGLLRDSQKLLILAIPAYVALAGLLDRWFGVAALTLALMQVPDAPVAVQQLRPLDVAVDEALVERAAGRDILFLDRGPLTTRPDGAVMIEPHTKAASVVESGELIVDGIRTDSATRRFNAAVEAYETGAFDRLQRLGVGLVVTPEGSVIETQAPPRDRTGGLLLLAWWIVLGLGLAVIGWSRRRGTARR